MSRSRLLVVDDEAGMRKNIRDLLAGESLEVLEAEDVDSARDLLINERIDLILLDINLPGMDGISALEEFRKRWAETPIIIFTAYGTSERAIQAMKKGAYDYIEKPFDADEMVLLIQRALEYRGLLGEVKHLRARVPSVASETGHQTIIGHTPQMRDVFKHIGKISSSHAPVLIEGESGTGKELIADAIQRHSPRLDRPYVKVNCAALSESLLESEIFGHEKGAFTGATSLRRGRFEVADTGTLLLDEISSMSPRLQVRLLRVLQHGTFFRLGSEKSTQVNVRLISLSNRNLETLVKQKDFREDLFYRINVIHITLPPLRERQEDIPLLLDHFLQKYSPEKHYTVPQETINNLKSYQWPGNVREMENVVQRALVMARGNVLHIDHLPMKQSELPGSGVDYEEMIKSGMSLREILDSIEKKIISETLHHQSGNRSRTAEILRIHRRYLYTKIKQFGL